MESSGFRRDRRLVWLICGLGTIAITTAKLLNLFEIQYYPHRFALMLSGAISAAGVLLYIVWRHRVARQASMILGTVAGVGVGVILLELPPVERLVESIAGRNLDEPIDAIQDAISYGLISLAAMGIGLLAIRSSEVQSEQSARQERLQASESQFRKAVIHAPFPVMIHAEGGEVLQLSRAWEEITGYSHAEIPTIPAWTRRAYGDKHAFAAAEIGKLYREKHGGPKGEYPIRTKEGDLRMWDFSVSAPGKDEGGRNVVVTMAMDTTDRRRAEREQADRNAVLEKLMSGAELSEVLSVVAETTERYSADWLCSILVRSGETNRLFCGAGPSLPDFFNEAIDGMAIGPEEGSCGAAAFTGQRVIAENIMTHPYCVRFRGVAQRANLGACWSEPIFSSTGKVLGTFALYHRLPRRPKQADLEFIATQAKLAGLAIERKRVEEALQKSEQLFRSSVDNARNVMVCLDTGGFVTEWNREAERVFGIGREEAVGSYYPSLRYPPNIREKVQKRMEWLLEGNDLRDQERLVVSRDGSERTILWNISLLKDDAGRITSLISSGQDITEYKQLQSQMQHAQKLESLGVLAGGIAHDFNNLLVGILGNADLVKAELGEDSRAAEGVDLIRKSAEHAAHLTQQMLAYTGKGRATVEPQDLSRLVEAMCDLLHVSVSKTVTLRKDLAAGLPAIEADASQLQQVVMNLITNASEAIGNEGGMITLTTGVVDVDDDFLSAAYSASELGSGECVYLRVADTGCGMNGETVAKMFDPFFTTKFAGRGLGLAAVLGIVRGHRGAVKVDSEAGKGTTIWIVFPQAGAVVPEPIRSIEPSGITERIRTDGTVLVVDDEATVLSVAQRVLESAGFAVFSAVDGQEGVEVFREHLGEIDAVLLDMTMPKMGGADTLAALRQIDPEVHVILTSGYDEENLAGEFGNGNGRQWFLRKPYGARGLIDTMDLALAHKRESRSAEVL